MDITIIEVYQLRIVLREISPVALVLSYTPTGVVRCDQPRALDLFSRHARKLESVPAAIMDEVLAKLAPFFE